MVLKLPIVKDALFRSFQSLFKQLVVLLPSLLLVKHIDAESYGVFSMLIGVATITVSFSDFGVTVIALRELIHSKSSNEKKHILGSALFLPLFFSVFFCIVTFFYLKDKVNYELVYLCILLIFVSPFYLILDSFLRSNLQFQLISQRTIISALISFSLQYFLFRILGMRGVFIGIISFYICFTLLNSKTLFQFCGKPQWYLIKRILNQSLFIGLGTIGYLLSSRLDIIIFTEHKLIKQIGHYEYINKLFDLLLYPFAIIGQVIIPRLINKNINSVKSMYKKFLLWILTISTFVSICIYIFSPLYYNLSPYFSEDKFTKSFNLMLFIYPLRVLTIFQSQTFFLSLKLEKSLLFLSLSVGFLSFGLNTYFIPKLGVEGAYSTSLVLTFLTLIAQIFILFKHFRKVQLD